MKNSLLSWLFIFCGCSLLPAQQTVGLFLNDSLSLNGYTLFSSDEQTYLIDNCGKLINSWKSTYDPGLSTYLLNDGRLLRTASKLGEIMGAGAGGRIEIFDWEGTLLWFYDYNTIDHRQHHDIEPLPNGNILLLAWEVYSKEEAIAAGRDPEKTEKDLWPDHIVEIQPLADNQATIVWEWHAWDHLVQDFDNSKANFGVVSEHPELLDINYQPVEPVFFPGVTGEDWLHSNGLSYNDSRDEIVISLRNFSEIIIIDHSTTTEEAAGHSGGKSGKGGDLLYRWGNPQAYQRGDSTDRKFYQQHDPKWIPSGYPNEGQLIVYNNGNDRGTEEYSSIDIINPPLTANGQYQFSADASFGPTQNTWTYSGSIDQTFYSSFMSGVQPLSNGNFLICVAVDGHFLEVTPDEKIVWDYISPIGINGPIPQGNYPGVQNIFRATRLPLDHPAFANRLLAPGEPIELQPWPSDCVIYGPNVSASPIPQALAGIQVQSNPFDHQLQLLVNSTIPFELTINDPFGKRLYHHSKVTEGISIDTQDWAAGIYFLYAREAKGDQVWVKKILKQ